MAGYLMGSDQYPLDYMVKKTEKAERLTFS